MKVLLSWLNEMLPEPITAEAASRALLSVGIEVGTVHQLAEGLENVVVAEIKAMMSHPNADRLTLCKVSDGAAEYSIVCGAKNMKTGDRVALAKIGAKLPNGMEIKKSKIRGETSEGMLCSESELGFKEESEGILILSASAAPGMSLSVALGRDDAVLEVELTPNRGDCLGVMGIAREVAAALGVAPKIPAASGEGPQNDAIRLQISDSAGCPRYVLRRLDQIHVGDSPPEMKRRLEASDIRSINSVVDVTNYVLLEWGQPLHAFDAGKVVGGIIVRRANSGERVLCLDDKERELSADDLVIADHEGVIAIAGVMGGKRTAVSESTTSILLECASFDPVSVRRTSKRLRLHTDASHRFERFVDPEISWAASERATELLTKVAAAQHLAAFDFRASPPSPRKLTLRRATLERILGEDLKKAGEYLARLGFSVQKLDEAWVVEVPTRRPDVEREIDLVEEVARIHGYDRFTSKLPIVASIPKVHAGYDALDRLRNICVASGLREICSYSFSEERDFSVFEEHPQGALRIANPLTPEHTHLRVRLVSGLIRAWRLNRSRQVDGIKIFEIGTVFGQSSSDREPAAEDTHLAALWSGEIQPKTWYAASRTADFFDAKGALEHLAQEMGWDEMQFRTTEPPRFLHPGQSAWILWKDRKIGYVGALHPSVCRTMDVPLVNCFELNLTDLLALKSEHLRYRPFSSFPSVTRDLAFVASKERSAADFISRVRQLRDPILQDVRIFDVYEGKGIPEGSRSVALMLQFGSSERTLTDSEVDQSVAKIVSTVEKSLEAKLRG